MSNIYGGEGRWELQLAPEYFDLNTPASHLSDAETVLSNQLESNL